MDEAPAFSFSKLPCQVKGPSAPFGRVVNLIRFMRDPAAAQLRWGKQFAGEAVISPVAGDGRMTLAVGPEALRHLSTRQGSDGDWTRPEAGGIKLVPGSVPAIAIRGISTTNGEEHAARRKPAMAASHGRERMAPVEQTYAEHAEQAVAALGDRGDLAALCSEYSSRNSVSVVFGLTDDTLVRARLRDIDTFMEGATSPLTLLLQKDWPLTPYRRWLRTTDRLYEWAVAVIAAKQGQAPEQRSILGALASAPDEQGNPPSAERLVGDAVNLYVVGHGSTWQQIAWALLLLAANADAQRSLREELAPLGGRAPISDDVLPHLDACLYEAMRLLPATHSLNPRMARREVELGGTLIPAGAMVLGAQLLAHHDPAYWTDAKAFRPTRWLDGFKPDPYSFLPFGQGARRCVGDALAWSQMRALVGTLLGRRFLGLVAGARYDYQSNIIQLMPKGPIPVQFLDTPGQTPLAGTVGTELLG